MRQLTFKNLWVVTVLGCVLFFGCTGVSSREPSGEGVKENAAVIFIPGYKGSRLETTPSGDTVWLTVSEILFGDRSLALEAERVGISDVVQVVPGGLLKGFSIIPRIYSFSVYESWSNFLKKSMPKTTKVIEFDYDWRGDNAEHAKRLGALVDGLKSNGITRVSVLAHSMGGMILSYYLRYGGQDPETAKETWEGAKNIENALFAGTPFRGSVIIMNDLLKGNPASLNDTLLSRDALGTFYSTYELLPASGDTRVVLSDGTPTKIDLLDWENWKKNDWGFLKGAEPSTIRSYREQLLAERLRRARLFSGLINAPATVFPDGTKTKIRTVIGTGRSTLARIIYDPKSPLTLLFKEDEIEEALGNFNISTLFDDGDGLVTVDSATLPPAYAKTLSAETWINGSEHGDYFDDETIRARIVELLGS